MRRSRLIYSLFMSLALLAVSVGNALAVAPGFYTPPQPPQSPYFTHPAESQPVVADPTGIKLPTLRAVLVVGPIDGPSGKWTLTEIENMKLAEAELISHGVQVSAFYAPNDSWDTIRTAAAGAHFFFYRGHGVSDGNNPLNVGGIYLTSGYVSPDNIRSGLHLAKNAIVMMYGCYMAGSSSEDVNLSSSEAYRRVVQYSDPFFSAGAGGYFANWFGDAFQYFVRYLFEGKSLGNAYKSYFDYGAATTESFARPADSSAVIWLDKDYWSGGYKYDNAFVGQANKTLWDLFNTTMVTNSSSISRIATPTSSTQTSQITVTGTTSMIFTWTASLSLNPNYSVQNANTPTNSWVTLHNTTGQTGEQISLTLNPAQLTKGTYSATLHLHSDTIGVNQPDQSITIELRVADSWNTVYIPLTIH